MLLGEPGAGEALFGASLGAIVAEATGLDEAVLGGTVLGETGSGAIDGASGPTAGSPVGYMGMQALASRSRTAGIRLRIIAAPSPEVGIRTAVRIIV
jgi:hypothetical protein